MVLEDEMKGMKEGSRSFGKPVCSQMLSEDRRDKWRMLWKMGSFCGIKVVYI